MHESRIRLLVLYADYVTRLSYYDDWLDAFTTAPAFDVTAVDIVRKDARERIRRGLAECDACVLLHSTNGDTTVYLESHLAVLADRRVPLLSFVGNEVNLPGSPIGEKRRALGAIAPDWIATQLLQEAGQFLFGDIARKGVVSIPHALNPHVFRPTLPTAQRPVDIGAVVARYVPHLGDNDRNRLVNAFLELGRQGTLAVDISDIRHNRAGWAGFLNRCRGTVASEAGSWFLERDDATVNAIRAYVRSQTRGGIMIANDSPLRRLGHKLPWRLREFLRRMLKNGPLKHEAMVNEGIGFDEIHAKFFGGRPRPNFYGKCISSRNFDAAGTKTCQIMLRGRFNDILAADRHYLALDDDLGNLDDVLRRFGDVGERERIVDAAYAEMMQAHTYSHRMLEIEKLLRQG